MTGLCTGFFLNFHNFGHCLTVKRLRISFENFLNIFIKIHPLEYKSIGDTFGLHRV